MYTNIVKVITWQKFHFVEKHDSNQTGVEGFYVDSIELYQSLYLLRLFSKKQTRL